FEAGELSGSGKVALIGLTVARQLFGDADPLDQQIRIKNVPHTIIGVLDRKAQSSQGQDQDDVIMVPLSTARNRLFG
ncbi:ABC transporter permease, partial [Acinetobacter baumannii]